MKYSIAASALAASILLATSAVALSPSTTTLVSDVSLSVPSNFAVEDTTAYVGIVECERMVANNTPIGVTYGTTFDTTLDPDLYDGVLFFDVERASTARVDCTSGELCSEVDSEEITQSADIVEVETDFQTLTGFTTSEDCANIDREFFVRLQLREIASDDELELADARIVVDAVRPEAPSLKSVTVSESSIRAEFDPSSSSDLLRYRIVFSTEAFSEGELPDDLGAEGRTFGNENVVSGDVAVELEAGETVYVAIAAQDETGNFSPVSAVQQATVLETTDFWEAYKQAGGADEGCTQAPTHPTPAQLFWLAFAGFAALIRRGTKR